MAKQDVKLGVEPTGVGGDNNRSAHIKINSNFTELYKAMGAVWNEANSGEEGAVLPPYLPVQNGGTGNDVGKAPTAEKLHTARKIAIGGGVTGTGTDFDGSKPITIDVTSIDASKILVGTIPAARIPTLNQNTTGNAGTANKLKTAINFQVGNSTKTFDGSVSVNFSLSDIGALPQDSNAVSASKLRDPVKIHGVDFDGSMGINLPVFSREKDGMVPYPTTTTSTRFLREDGTWVVPTNTTYSVMTTTEWQTGTASTARLISPIALKAAIEYHGANLTGISGNAGSANKLKTAVSVQIGDTSKEFDGSTNLSFSHAEILPAAATGQILKFNGLTWVPANESNAPPVITQTEANTGTATQGRLISASVLKSAIQTHAPVPTNITGNAGTATKLKNAVKINGIDFNGESDITIKTGSSAFIGSVSWFSGNYMKMPDGYQAGSGQIYNRADYPDMWAAIESGQYEAIDDATWLADPSQRAKFSTGNGTSTFRMQDLNGVQPGSLNAPFLRGKGTFAVGTVLSDAIRNITGVYNDGNRSAILDTTATTSGVFYGTRERTGTTQTTAGGTYKTWDLGFDASRVVPTADENRPISAVGLWIVKVRGDTTSAASSDAATLMHNEYHGNQIVNGDVIINGNIVIRDTAGIRVDLPLGFIEWFNGNRTKVRIGTLPADGQLLKRADYPGLWAEIERGAFECVTDAVWLDNSVNDYRACYSYGDGSTTFRLPDLNGMQANSKKGLFLRGSGTKAVGRVEGDAIRDIQGTTPWKSYLGDSGGAYTNSTSVTGAFVSGTRTTGGHTLTGASWASVSSSANAPMEFRASNVVPTAEENRPVSAVGVWIIRVNGGVPNSHSEAPVATLDSNIFNGGQTFNSDVDIKGNTILKGAYYTRKSKWTKKTGRLFGTTYVNSSSYEKEVAVVSSLIGSTSLSCLVTFINLDAGEEVSLLLSFDSNAQYNALSACTFTVPPNTSYKVDVVSPANYSLIYNASLTVSQWAERDYYV